MFFLAILLGLYSYAVFFLGITGMLSPIPVLVITLLFGGAAVFYYRTYRIVIPFPKGNVSKLTLCFLAILAFVNIVGVLGPETAFDALWYHLTLPKIYLQEQIIQFIPGGLFYYSVMPKLGEMLFIPALLWGNEVWAKAIQCIFGLLTTVVIYNISRRYLSEQLSLVASLIFYSNIVVAWESTVAYIDLIRAFYEIMGVWGLLLWVDTKKKRWLYLSALMIGFAISTKLLALGSLVIVSLLVVYILWKNNRLTVNTFITYGVIYWIISISIVFPWLLFSYLSTGNPVYPFFTPIYPVVSGNILALPELFHNTVKVLLFADDPISPIYLIVLPLVFVSFTKLPMQIKVIAYYSLFSIIVWFLTPKTGGGRFILPYLSAWSLLVVGILDQIKKQQLIYKATIITIFLIALLTLFYRGMANMRYLPVILGKETKDAFLTKQLNFSFGDFYDTDGYLKKHIKPTDRVLLYGFHNLYYIDFPFIDASYVKKGDMFTHIATQNTNLPKRFADWNMVYENKQTSVTLYTKGEKPWVY